MSSNLVPFPGATEERAAGDRNQRLFEWCKALFERLGLAKRVKEAGSFEDLRKITFNADAAEVELAIRDALHPASGRKADMFTGIKEGGLKRILINRFADLKKDRENELKRGAGGKGGKQSAYIWTDDLRLDDKGGVRPLLANLILFLRHHNKWAGVFAYDEFNARVVVRKRPPWGDEPADAPLTDHHESSIRVWFQREDIAAAQGDVGRAVQAVARHSPFHPVRDYFEALKWDGTPRLDTWLIAYLHADDTEYTRAVGPRWLISAAARIYQPGAKVDHMLVLEGPQGRLKSEALRALAVRDEWFTDRLSHIAGKDAMLETAGVLLVEIAELDATTRASSSASKRFLTSRHDRFRPPYGKHPITLPRQCVFAGTVNPPVGGYLKDPTGARRIWPVTCHGMIDRDGIERDRDQLWAEAVVRFKAGAPWWLETDALEALATAEQAMRFKVDVWRESVEQWIGARKDVSVSEVLRHALGIAEREQTQSAFNRVAAILTELGFTKHRPRKGHGRENRYWLEK
jgi:predicted P-loop ATPase